MDSERKYFLWDDLEVGKRFEPMEYVLKRETIQKYLLAVQDETGIFSDPECAVAHGLADQAAPPTMAAIYSMKAYARVPAPPGGIHAKQKFKFFNPAYPGDVLLTTVEIIDKYIKREKKYVEMTTETRNHKGEMIVKGWTTRIWAK